MVELEIEIVLSERGLVAAVQFSTSAISSICSGAWGGVADGGPQVDVPEPGRDGVHGHARLETVRSPVGTQRVRVAEPGRERRRPRSCDARAVNANGGEGERGRGGEAPRVRARARAREEQWNEKCRHCHCPLGLGSGGVISDLWLALGLAAG
jgi:hypothetical protein